MLRQAQQKEKGKGKRETGDRMLRQAQQPENGDKWSNEGGIPFEDLGISEFENSGI
jgi:hypothetical protein